MALSMERWVGKVAIVTGASAGIGAAIAESLVKEGLKVVALARRKVRLEILARDLSKEKGKLIAIQTDISNEEEVLEAFKYIKENVGPVHIVINNAGVHVPNTSTIEGDTEGWRKTYDVNVLGLCVVTREAIKDMRANNVDGHIIHINSLLGHQVINAPGLSVYPSSKFAVRALAETLRLELMRQKSKIKISNVSPGLVETEFQGANEFRQSDLYKKMVAEKQILKPEDVAAAVVYVLSTPPHVQLQELTIRAISEIF